MRSSEVTVRVLDRILFPFLSNTQLQKARSEEENVQYKEALKKLALSRYVRCG